MPTKERQDKFKNDVRASTLASLLKSYAQNSTELAVIDKMIADKATVKDYVYALTDGLKYGNWPWTFHSNMVLCEDCGVKMLNGKLPFIYKVCTPCMSERSDTNKRVERV